MQQALESLFDELVFGPELDEHDAAAASDWLSRWGLPPAERAALLADFPRLCVYRKLVRGTLREAIELAMPRTVARLGSTFDEHFARFLSERPPSTHYLRDVASDFLSYCTDAWRHDERVPPWALELGRHEALRIEIGAMPAPSADRAEAELELSSGVRFSQASRVVRYEYAVHRLSEDESDRSEPARQATALFVYRSPEHEVRYLELSPVAAGLLERLREQHRTLQQALTEACLELSIPLDQQVLEGTARLLADLAERGVLLGRDDGAPEIR